MREHDARVSAAPRRSSEAAPAARWDIHIWAFPSGPSTGLPGLLELPEQREEEESRGRPVTGLARKSIVSKHAVVTQIHVRTCLWDLESNQTKPFPGAPTAVGENSEPTPRPPFPPGTPVKAHGVPRGQSGGSRSRASRRKKGFPLNSSWCKSAFPGPLPTRPAVRPESISPEVARGKCGQELKQNPPQSAWELLLETRGAGRGAGSTLPEAMGDNMRAEGQCRWVGTASFPSPSPEV